MSGCYRSTEIRPSDVTALEFDSYGAAQVVYRNGDTRRIESHDRVVVDSKFYGEVELDAAVQGGMDARVLQFWNEDTPHQFWTPDVTSLTLSEYAPERPWVIGFPITAGLGSVSRARTGINED